MWLFNPNHVPPKESSFIREFYLFGAVLCERVWMVHPGRQTNPLIILDSINVVLGDNINLWNAETQN